LDEEWIVEHAAQAARTLPGGLDILGIYILCDDKTFQAGQGVILNALKKVNQELGSNFTTAAAAAPLIALHIDSITAKIAAREVSGASLRVCEVKPSSLVANMVEIQCQYHVDLKVNLAGGKQRLHDAIREAVTWQSENRVHPALALIDDQIPESGQQIVDVLKNKGTSLYIELLTPCSMPPATLAAVGTNLGTDLPPSLTNGKGEYQRQVEFVLEGALDCRAFVHKREPLRAAIEAIKGDIERTLLTRIDILVEAAQMATDEAQARFDATAARDAKSGKTPPPSSSPVAAQGVPQAPKHPLLLRVAGVDVYKPTLPRRAFLKWSNSSGGGTGNGNSGGGCSFCDYIVEGEGVSEAVQRVQELMGADSVNPSTFQCEEKLAAGVLSGGGGAVAGVRRGKGRSSGIECNVVTVGAISVALVALYLSWTLMS
jgi:Odorant response abnormal 4-like